MGKTALIYNSKYGSTERYARWIAEETDADLFSDSDVKVRRLAEYETIVFGGPIHTGGIQGIKFLQKNMNKFEGKRVIAFAVGLTLDNEKLQKECREINFVKRLEDVPCFFLKGAYFPEKIKGVDKGIMAFVKKMISGKPENEMTGNEKELLLAITEGRDYVDRSYIAPLVDEINRTV